MILEIESKRHGSFKIQYDEEDKALIKKHTWYIAKQRNKFYVMTNIKSEDGKQRTKYLHSLIMGTPKGMHTDHINGDTLNNRKENLRIVTCAENCRNRGKQKNNTSGFKGVSAHGNGWKAQVQHNKEYKYFGTYKTRAEAGRARDRGVAKLRNLITPQMLNYPDEYDFESKRFKDLSDKIDTLTDEIRAESTEIILISNREIIAQMLKNRETLK